MTSTNNGVLSGSEQGMAAKLWQTFATEMQQLDDGLNVLRRCVLRLTHSNVLLNRPNLTAQLAAADAGSRGLAVWTILVSEALERFTSGRLLFISGHYSRALSCLRDAVESLQWAEVCMVKDDEAERWVHGKKVKGRSCSYPPQRSLPAAALRFFNTHGTHPYVDACLLSVYPLTGLTPSHEDSGDGMDDYQFFTRRNLLAFLQVTASAIEYVLNRQPELENEVADARKSIRQLVGTHDTLARALNLSSPAK